MNHCAAPPRAVDGEPPWSLDITIVCANRKRLRNAAAATSVHVMDWSIMGRLQLVALATLFVCQSALAQLNRGAADADNVGSMNIDSEDGAHLDPYNEGEGDSGSAVNNAYRTSTSGNPNRRLPTNEQVSKPVKLLPLAPNGFQRFVQQSTGRLLPLHGIAAFEQGADFGPPRSAAVPADYALGPGDEVFVQLTGIADIQMRLVVDRDGRITIPKVGTISVVGVKASELEPFLDKQFRRTFKTFTLSATLGAIRPIDIYLVGQARQPGRHTISALSSFVSAVLTSAGPDGGGTMRHVELVRNRVIIASLDVYAFLATGRVDNDVRLQPGDTIVFPPAGPRVALMGDLHAPAIYELNAPDDPLDALLKVAGGLPVTTSRRRATVERIDPMAADPRRVESLVLDNDGLGRALRDGDMVTFLPISPAFENAVTLRGNVATPLRYPFTPGMRVRDLIPDREALISPEYYRKKNLLVQFDSSAAPSVNPGATPLTPTTPTTQQNADVESSRRNVKDMLDEVNWEYAVVERLDRQTLQSRLVPFHLGRAVLAGDERDNVALEAGDVVTVFSSRDLAVPQARRTRMVRVEGEVKAPGIYQITAGETLASLLERVGGTSEQAYLFGLALRRESVRKAQQETLNSVIRQLEDDVRAHLAQRQSNLPTSADPAQMMAFQAQLQVEERIAIDRMARLRAARPEGRIALELDPAAPVIPDVILEDGDAISIPPLPSFVSIVGAVHNENGLIWKEGRTVSEYLALAGATPNADLDNVFVLRADGSVRSREPGFWGWVPAQNHGLALEPGDVVIVPERMDLESGYTIIVRGLKDWTQILANMGIAVASVTLLFR